jgi:hypothetical protein
MIKQLTPIKLLHLSQILRLPKTVLLQLLQLLFRKLKVN